MSTVAGNPRNHLRTALLALSIAAGMGGLAYASVPLYRIFCQVTGFGGTTMKADEAAVPSAEQVAALGGKMVEVRFDGNVRGISWEFAPTTRTVQVKIGEQNLAYYRAKNLSDVPVTGTATFNVSPAAAGAYFNKIQCFCFNEQTLQPGQEVEMPVVYFVDPAILDDPDARNIKEITLSYTFFPVEAPTRAPGIYATGKAEIPARGA
ncbi:cytochrome c oxidase assembly protein [Sandaracinobacteroides sp. A072]|uniref:cytochrome c oxidase assembly protein n=1 Tax=Sandaracinobacteroides sp. A072 TaxID=3461146 RepID=UPI004042D335